MSVVVADYLMNNCVDLYDEIYNRGFVDGFKEDKKDEYIQGIDDLAAKIKYSFKEAPEFKFQNGMIISFDMIIDVIVKQLKDGE